MALARAQAPSLQGGLFLGGYGSLMIPGAQFSPNKRRFNGCESHIIPPITAQKKCLAQVRGLVNSSPVLYRSLVGGLEHGFYDFPYIGNVIIPTDELHHFSEG